MFFICSVFVDLEQNIEMILVKCAVVFSRKHPKMAILQIRTTLLVETLDCNSFLIFGKKLQIQAKPLQVVRALFSRDVFVCKKQLKFRNFRIQQLANHPLSGIHECLITRNLRIIKQFFADIGYLASFSS